MIKKKIFYLLITGSLLILILSPHLQFNLNKDFIVQPNDELLKSSSSLDGVNDVLIKVSLREVNVLPFGLINVQDKLTILNKNNNPVTSLFIGVPLSYSNDLMFFKAEGIRKNSLLTERSNMIMNDFEIINVYFESPLLPNQETTIIFYQTYNNLISYQLSGIEQSLNYTNYIYPLLPYRTEGDVQTLINVPETSNVVNIEQVLADIGRPLAGKSYLYDLADTTKIDHLDPFLTNIEQENREITIMYEDRDTTKLEIEKIIREIHVSPWGIIEIKENLLIHNKGIINVTTFPINISSISKNLRIYDSLGMLSIRDVTDPLLTDPEKLSIGINLIANRPPLTPNSKYSLNIKYNLPFEEHYSLDWFKESIKMDLFTTTYEYLIKEQEIDLIIEGINDLEYISSPPSAIINSQGSHILSFYSENIGPLENKVVQFTFSIDLFELLARPIILTLVVALFSSIYVLIIKVRKREMGLSVFTRESIPINEIREYCVLYEEMNALILEIRNAEDAVKQKKLAKKQYNNILKKNSSKIETIKKEIIPFKQTLMKTNEAFDNIIKRLDVLDAERISLNDSLNLLENRYKMGKLPSKAAYQKLSNDFMNRRKKIDRTIDKNIQQLRSYLL
ncbi:MAG: hypothetical protein ACFE85_15025 [Candidatus Hodarchaeota archaeon]